MARRNNHLTTVFVGSVQILSNQQRDESHIGETGMSLITETDTGSARNHLYSPAFIKDMLLTLVAALLTGLSAGVVLILLVFALGSVQV
jgi:hypothetical protein